MKGIITIARKGDDSGEDLTLKKKKNKERFFVYKTWGSRMFSKTIQNHKEIFFTVVIVEICGEKTRVDFWGGRRELF